MRNPTAIHVQSAIAHLVRRNNSQGGPTYSQALLDLSSAGLTDFLTAHIRNSLTSERTQSANFVRDAEDVTVYNQSRALLNDNADLIAASTAIARHLQAALEAQRAASESTLICCIYTVDNEPQETQFLALLKLEPASAFRPQTETRHGRTVVTLIVIDDVLPTEREQLQKAALIRPPGDRRPPFPRFDLMILDRQQRGEDAGPAGYFMKFLAAILALDARQATYAFKDAVASAVNSLGDGITDEDRELVDNAVRTGLRSNRVDPVAIIENLAIDDDIKTSIVEAVRSAITDRAFSPDQEVAQKITRFEYFEGGNHNEIKLKIDADLAADRSVFKYDRQQNGDTVVTIKTSHWQKVAR